MLRYIVGNHLGPYLGQPPTGKLVRYRFAFNWYLAEGKVRNKLVEAEQGYQLVRYRFTLNWYSA